MTAQHTPGPWTASKSIKGYWFFEHDQGGEQYTLFACADYGTPSEADVRLIAAAPDMLEALKLLLIECEKIEAARCQSFSACDDARNAIARATGSA